MCVCVECRYVARASLSPLHAAYEIEETLLGRGGFATTRRGAVRGACTNDAACLRAFRFVDTHSDSEIAASVVREVCVQRR